MTSNRSQHRCPQSQLEPSAPTVPRRALVVPGCHCRLGEPIKPWPLDACLCGLEFDSLPESPRARQRSDCTIVLSRESVAAFSLPHKPMPTHRVARLLLRSSSEEDGGNNSYPLVVIHREALHFDSQSL
ncbi:unnamed protein product [Gadus morhua 'NCC']